jgi:hypothetical protein
MTTGGPGCARGADSASKPTVSTGGIESINCLFIPAGDEMPVEIDGDLDRGMAIRSMTWTGFSPVLQEQRGEGMAEIIEADLLKALPMPWSMRGRITHGMTGITKIGGL